VHGTAERNFVNVILLNALSVFPTLRNLSFIAEEFESYASLEEIVIKRESSASHAE
jgi:hypothetical protein